MCSSQLSADKSTITIVTLLILLHLWRDTMIRILTIKYRWPLCKRLTLFHLNNTFSYKQGASNGPLPISKILQSCAMTNLVENIIHNTHHCGM